MTNRIPLIVNAGAAQIQEIASSDVLTVPGTLTANVVQTNNYQYANGQPFTGGSSDYGNSNVATLLAVFGSNTISTTGNVTSGNVVTGGVVSAAGNVRGANFNTVGAVSATGNITGNYFIGNGSQLTGVTATSNTGNVTFDNQVVIGTGTTDGGGGLYLAPGPASIAENVQYLRVRGGDYPTHIHLDTGNNVYFDQYFGADSKYVKLEANGNVVINADDYNGNSGTWNFDVDGNLTVPGNIQSVTTGFPFTANISGINTGNPTVIVTLIDSVFSDPVTGQVTITGVIGTTEANNTWYYLSIDPSNFQLYYDQALANPVDGTEWAAYVSGGLAVAAGYSNVSITSGNLSVVTNTGNTWIFGADGNLTIPNDIISTRTIDIDNRASGNTADIQLFAADDIVLQARDRSAGSGTEGGDINIYAGDSAEDGDSSGGDIIIEAGRGGAANVDFGGAGGFIRIESGRGGAAIGNTGATAESGGSLTLNAGDAGDNNGNIDLGASGGDVYIESGFSTGNTNSGGNIVLTTGTGGQNGASGVVRINIPGYGLTTGGIWTFDATGNLNLPINGDLNFSAGGIIQAVDEDFTIRVQDADDDGFALLQEVDDGAGNVLGLTQLRRDQFLVEFAGGGAPQFRFTNNGEMQLPGNVRWDNYQNQSLYAVADNNGNGTVELKTISYASDTLGSNIRVSQSNATISTSNAAHTWLFDNTGNLNLPLGGSISEGPSPSLLGNTVTITPAGGNDPNQQLKIYPTFTEGNHLHLTSGNLAVTDVFLGDDSQYIRTTTTGGMTVGTGGGEISGGYVWSFEENGNLIFPDGTSIGSGAFNGPASSTVSLNAFSPDGNTVSFQAQGNTSSAVISIFSNAGPVTSNWTFTTAPLDPSESFLYVPNGGAISTPDATGGEGGKNIFIVAGASDPVTWNSNPGGELIIQGGYGSFGDGGGGPGGNVNINGGSSSDSHAGNVNITCGPNSWVFDYSGNVTVPGNINAVLSSPAPSLNGFNSVNAVNVNASGNITGGRVSATGNILTNAQIQSTAFTGGNISWSANNQTDFQGAIKVGGTGVIKGPGGASSITLNNNGANIPILGVTNTGNSTSTTTGVLIVSGGAGVAGNVYAGGLVSATGNITGGNIVTAGNVSGNTAGYAIGYRDIPQVGFTGDATIAITDAGKHYYSTQSTSYTLTIANNASQGFQVGAAITIVNQGSGTITVAQGSGVTLYLAGNSTAGNRSVATFGMATIIKVATNTWFINGTGVS